MKTIQAFARIKYIALDSIMPRSKGAIATIEMLIVLPIIFLVFMFFVEAWKFVYTQQALNQAVNYSVNFWAKNKAPSCKNVEEWLKLKALTPALAPFGIEANQIDIKLTYPYRCNCAGGTITITATFKSKLFDKFVNPSAYAIAIKEGDFGANCH